jgi:triphosphoribosyl-dephospho-CoA synthase
MTGNAAFLEARDRRQKELDCILAQPGSQTANSFLLISSNIPGRDKHRPGVASLLRGALDSLRRIIELKTLVNQRDVLGPFYIAACNVPPVEAKRIATTIEAETPSARLLDVDVYGLNGIPIDRATLGFAPRSCLLCSEPARECILTCRHSMSEVLEKVDSLLRPFMPQPRTIPAETLATNLHVGLLRELNLTPKPGLVDRHDNGSHTDLSYTKMLASAALLPSYFDQLLEHHCEQRPLQDFVQAGVDAENRMLREIQSNAHKGFIFLAGLILMAACACGGRADLLRQEISSVGRKFFAHFGSPDSHGTSIRSRYGMGGIRAEVEQGLPAVFEHGWPMYREALQQEWDPKQARFYLMAILMQHVEDTTTVHRGGLEGLSRLRRDGAHLQKILEQQRAPEPVLSALNREYRGSGLTMGGVADCMALTFALQETATY